MMIASTLLASIFLSASIGAQEVERREITGTVLDSTGLPVGWVNVHFGSARVLSNDSGRFSIRAPGADVQLLFRRVGFHPAEVRLPPGGDTAITVRLSPVAVRLSTVQVFGERASLKLETTGFYGRMRDVERGINRGYFVTPEDLEQRRPNFITQMMENYPALRVYRERGEPLAEVLGVGGCKMTIYLDGVRVVGTLNPRMEQPVNTVVRPGEIAGVEVYPRASVAPPRYQSLNGLCGVILIWTR